MGGFNMSLRLCENLFVGLESYKLAVELVEAGKLESESENKAQEMQFLKKIQGLEHSQ